MNVSKINELRRDALNKFRDKFISRYHQDITYNFKEIFDIGKVVKPIKEDKYLIYVSTQEQFDAVYSEGFRDIIISPFMFHRKREFDKILDKKDLNLYVKFPTIIKEYEMEKILKAFKKFEGKIKGILKSNAVVLRYFRDFDYEIIGDVKNIFNEISTRFYDNVDIFTISVELSKEEVNDLSNNTQKDFYMFVYGKPDIMVSEYCSMGTFVGKRSIDNVCSRSCMRTDFYLKDRVNNKLQLLTEINGKIHIYKENPIDLISEISDLKSKNINIFRLDFIDESYE